METGENFPINQPERSAGSSDIIRRPRQNTPERPPDQTPRLEDLREELATISPHQGLAQGRILPPRPGTGEFRGFRQQPLKVIRNTVFFPTTETNIQMAIATGGIVASAALGLSALGFPEMGGVVALAGEGLVLGELGSLLLRKKGLSEFLKVHKNKVTKEKILSDGTRITLDDKIGELHVSGLTKLWQLNFDKDKTKRTLIVMEGVLQGLVNLAERADTDPWFKDIKAFKGTSFIVNPRISERMGFQVESLEGAYISLLSRAIRTLDKKIMMMPKELGTQEIHLAWISKERLLSHKGDIQAELEKVQRALERRKSVDK